MNIAVKLKRSRTSFAAQAQGIRQRASTIIRETGAEIVQIERQLSRVDTGEMRDGWQFAMESDLRGRNFNEVEHTIYNEYGTRHMPAQPMLAPAFDQLRPRFLQRLEMELFR